MDIELRKQAAKYLEKQTGKTRKRLDNALIGLANLDGDICKIGLNTYRLKIFQFRFVFGIESDTIIVYDINSRTNIKY